MNLQVYLVAGESLIIYYFVHVHENQGIWDKIDQPHQLGRSLHQTSHCPNSNPVEIDPVPATELLSETLNLNQVTNRYEGIRLQLLRTLGENRTLLKWAGSGNQKAASTWKPCYGI